LTSNRGTRGRGCPQGRTAAIVVAAVAVGLSCSEETGVTPLVVDGTARITGQLFLDANGSGVFESGFDDVVASALLRLRLAASGSILGETQTDAQGLFDFESIPVGTLRLEVDSILLGDSLVARFEQSDTFSVAAGDSLGFQVGVGAPERSIPEIRSLPPDEPVFTSGIALNDWTELGGSIHLESDSSFLRVTGVPAVEVGVGDSIRVSGRTSTAQGIVFLVGGRAFSLEQDARPVTPWAVTTAQAGTAQGGDLEAALVVMSQVTVTSNSAVAGGFIVEGTDGTSEVSIRIRDTTGIDPAEVPVGTVFPSVVGVLVPSGPGVWEVVPRSRDDASPPN